MSKNGNKKNEITRHDLVLAKSEEIILDLIEIADHCGLEGFEADVLLHCVANLIHSIEIHNEYPANDQLEDLYKSLCCMIPIIKKEHNEILTKPESELDAHEKRVKAEMIKNGTDKIMWGTDGKSQKISSN